MKELDIGESRDQARTKFHESADGRRLAQMKKRTRRVRRPPRRALGGRLGGNPWWGFDAGEAFVPRTCIDLRPSADLGNLLDSFVLV